MASNPAERARNGGKGVAAPGEAAVRASVPDARALYPNKNTSLRLARILEEAGLVNEQMIQDLIRSGKEDAASIQRSLVQTGLVREDDILDALAQEMHLERVDFSAVVITPELIGQVPARIARKYRIFPVRYDEDTIWVALSDPLDIQTTDDLKMVLNKEVIGCVAPEEDIARAVRRYYEGDEISSIYEKTIEEEDESGVERRSGFKDYSKIDLDAENTSVNQPAVVKFVDLIFRQAVHERASDIHVEPARTTLEIRFRVDGVLHHVPCPPKKWERQIIARLKVMASMDLAEKRVPQDGRIKLNVENRKLDLRVSCLPAYFGETIVMRILDQSSVMLGLADVGFLPDNIERFRHLIRAPNGVILMTGPTGSGKTTTLYAALSTLNTVETKIITAEDPVEYQIAGINQVQIDKEIELNFAAALRAMLRQSPDIILVGEIRDLETAEIAIRAALTGHLVFSTLHTNDAPSATVRLVDIGIKPYLVGSSLAAVIAQRLVRRICGTCKKPYKPSSGELVEMGQDPRKVPEDLVFYKGEGCDRCSQFGYRGRTAIHEIMEMDSDLRRMVIRGSASTHLKAAAAEKGMRSLRMDGFEKIVRGDTTFEEVIRMTQED
ncbi:MAG: ATPase, T2SS/T4P/T4SS family [Candidatus Sumerlaeota bacterium]|nr:ATPase, T2SS/T4P/T4SS family [Candidatus Sumerlaeota bacterium]